MKIVFPYDGYESLGIGYLSAVAIQNGYDVYLHRLNFGDYIRGYKNMSAKRIEKEKQEIINLKPDIVAFSLNTLMTDPLVKLAYSLNRDGFKTIAGGPHATAEPESTTDTGAFNAVVAGEAENVFIDTVEEVMKGRYDLPWVFTSSNKKGEYVVADDLDKIPFPAKSQFYKINPFESDDYKIITARGCPYNCIFCSHSNPRVKSGFRRRSPDNVIKELISAKESYKIKSVYFLDDIFTINENWLSDFLKLYKQKIGLPFHAISHPNNIDNVIARQLRESGCFAIRLGVQTTTERIKERIGRKEDNRKVINALTALKTEKIKVEVDHMVGLPGETLQEGRNNISFYNQLRPDGIKVYWLMPLPGTVWFKQAVDQNYVNKEQAQNIKNGRRFGKHSYLFYNRLFNNKKWLGIHLILSYLPLLPKALVSFLTKIKADRFLGINSFLLIVGFPRFLNTLSKWDMVGKEHINRILRTFSPFSR